MTTIADLTLALGVLVRTGLIAGALAALWAGTRFTSRTAQRRVDALLVLLAVLSFCVWMNPGSIRYRTTFINWANVFHYYLGSKYRHEIGYFNIYGAAFTADAEEQPPYFGEIKVTRDLRDYRPVRPESLRGDPQFTARFSPERWQAFRADMAYIKRGFPPARWVPILMDHGNNAPPTQSALSGVFANLLGPADAVSIALLALLDPLLVALLLAVVYRAYSLRTAALVAISFGLNELSESGYIIGAFLRLDWLVAAGLGICCLRMRHYLLAGCLLGAATGLRIFPVFFALPVLLRGAIELVRHRTWPSEHRRFALGVMLGGSSLVVLSLAPNLDLQVWFDFIQKIRLHSEVVELGAINLVGLRQVFDEASLWLWLARGTVVLLFLSLLNRVNDVQATILGATLVFALLSIADYYYAFMLVFLLWQSWERVDARALLLIGLLLSSVSMPLVLLRALGVPMAQHFPAASLALLITFAVLYAQIRFPPKQAAT